MLTRLNVKNFRSIEDCSVEFGPITVFFGPTSAGKSTLLYAILVLRNFVANPNQALDGFFNLGFQNLGGFEACVFNHSAGRTIGIGAQFDGGARYLVELGKASTRIAQHSDLLNLEMTVSVPYPANQSVSVSYNHEPHGEVAVNWNGFACTVSSASGEADAQAAAVKLAELLNATVEALKRVDVCPHRRGFFKPSYTPTPLTPTPTSEDEVATLIINDQNVPPRIAISTGEIFGRDFRVYTPPGTATTFLQTTEQKGARVPGLLVNDGFGVNQVVYMLAKIHRSEVETIVIEEPEIHLHPTVIRSFARELVTLSRNEGKQLVFTTHSEQFLLSLLACVKEGSLRADDLQCYHVSREGKNTRFVHEPVSSNGQISGGLSTFMEAELQDIKTFLAVGD